MEDYKEFSREQVSAIRQSIKLGRTLKEDHPEIAVIYGYYSQTDIPIMLDIQSEYGVSDEVARTGVCFAINGHEEGFGIEGYVGLITDEEERERIGREHMVQGGQTTYEQGAGIHGRTAEQHSEDSQKGGQKLYEQGAGVHGRTAEQHSEDGREGGQTTYEEGLGVHGRTAKQHSEDGRKGGRKGAIARGQTPWSDEEKEFAYRLSQEQEYQHPKGPNRGRPNNELIAFALNIEYHDCNEVRSNNAVSVQLFRYKKSLDDMVA